MFTGLVEEMGYISSIEENDSGIILTIDAKKIMSDIEIDHSVSINGACQTVIWKNEKCFKVQAIKETLDKTNFMQIEVGQPVNLERAMKANTRFGGHFVQGHVNGLAKLVSKDQRGENWLLGFELNEKDLMYCTSEGSICLNGVSLTIAKLDNKTIFVSLIPHTLKHTNLNNLQINDCVNLEVDMMAKYLYQYFEKWQSGIKGKA